MLNLIRKIVQKEFSNVLISILAVIMLEFVSKTAMEYVDAFLYDNEWKHYVASKRIAELDHKLFHLEEDVDELYEDDASSDTSSETSEKVESDHVTV